MSYFVNHFFASVFISLTTTCSFCLPQLLDNATNHFKMKRIETEFQACDRKLILAELGQIPFCDICSTDYNIFSTVTVD